MPTSQYAGQKVNKGHARLLITILVLVVTAGYVICGKSGFALLGCLVGYGIALRRGYKSLDGMNGGISGYALTIGELCAVAVYALI